MKWAVLAVVRVFSFGVQGGFALQPSQACSRSGCWAQGCCDACVLTGSLQGQYNPSAFQALDFILSEAANHSLRLVVSTCS